jgi:hypothetical protein
MGLLASHGMAVGLLAMDYFILFLFFLKKKKSIAGVLLSFWIAV